GSTGGTGGSTGGSGGSTGGSAGAGGMPPDPRCPARPPSGACDAEGVSCRYDLSRMCLCTTVASLGVCTAIDPRCTEMARLVPDGGGAIPVSLSTCTCTSGSWVCRFP
ncbi:MAG TPA: hypothetical protein VFZ53_07090, partial [Polyangiaceae bacterium]